MFDIYILWTIRKIKTWTYLTLLNNIWAQTEIMYWDLAKNKVRKHATQEPRSFTRRSQVSQSSLKSFDYLPSLATCFRASFEKVSPKVFISFLCLMIYRCNYNVSVSCWGCAFWRRLWYYNYLWGLVSLIVYFMAVWILLSLSFFSFYFYLLRGFRAFISVSLPLSLMGLCKSCIDLPPIFSYS